MHYTGVDNMDSASYCIYRHFFDADKNSTKVECKYKKVLFCNLFQSYKNSTKVECKYVLAC